MKKYKIVRMFLNGPSQTVKRNLSPEEAQKHCSNPETSSKTCTKAEGKRRTELFGPWFDSYDEM